MKPRKLKIEGLNSFVNSQEIDFSRLTEKGFFGIFGPTGSGKSTILDAMTIALYGEISRSGKKNEFINSFKKDMNVVYEFEIGGATERRVYCVERHYKRKKDGAISCDRAVLIDMTDGEREQNIKAEGSSAVLEEIVSIIGLKCDDFTRSVVLPQGKFSEFLKLTKGDRGKMLERILSLEDFGSKMVTRLKAETVTQNSELDRLNGALGGFKEASDEGLELKKAELEGLLVDEKRLKEEKDKIEQDYKKFSEIWELQKELEIFESRKGELDKNRDIIEKKKLKIDRARHALAVKPFLDVAGETEGKIGACKIQVQQLTIKHTEMEKQLSITALKHEQALKLKDSRLQLLITKETELVEALKLEKEILVLDKELEGLRMEYEQYNKCKQNLEKDIHNNQLEKEKSQIIIDENEEKIKSIRVTPEYREKIANALLIEKEYSDITSKLKKVNMSINELGAHLVHQNTLLISIANEKENKEKALFEAVERRAELDRNNPDGTETLVAMQIRLQQMTAGIEELTKNNELWNKVTVELEDIAKKIDVASKSLEVQTKENAILTAEIEVMRHEIDTMKKKNVAASLAQLLEVGASCPVCGSQHHPEKAKKSDEDIHNLVEKERLLSELIIRVEMSQKLENELRLELAGHEANKRFKIEQLSGVRKELDGLDLVRYSNEKDKLEAEFKLLKDKNEKYINGVRDLEELTNRLKEEVHQAINKYGIAHAEYEKDIKQKEGYKKEYEEEKKRFDIAEKSYSKICSDLGIENISAENTRILSNASVEEKIRSEQDLHRQKINQLDSDRSILETQKIDTLGKLEAVKTSGVERRKVKDDFTNKMNKYTENNDPNQYYEKVLKEKTEIIENEAGLKKEYDEEKNALTSLVEDKLRAENNLSTLKVILAENSVKLELALKENNFASAEEVVNFILSRDMMLQFENEVKVFQEEYKTATDNIERIKKRLNGSSIDNEGWDKIVTARKDNEKDREANTGAVAACKGSIKRMESDLEEMRQLLDKRKLVTHQLDMLDDIGKLVAGNKFVEFAATNQLRHIAREASRRLGEITRGRYALELDSSNDFVMRDDYSGGIRRSADTLSGGETFLTSLCLALSLSSNIQLKGRSPLEFFFLDEGFGTLDSELLEVVMSSLERLRSDRLCVGIISHVEELKNRVPIKLIVSPATVEGEGTKVVVEYS